MRSPRRALDYEWEESVAGLPRKLASVLKILLNFPPIFLYFPNGQGQRQISLVVKRSRDGMKIIKGDAYVELKAPNDLLELFFDLKEIVFPEAGRYDFEVLDYNNYIFERSLFVKQSDEEFQRRRW
jgi:hypothetical protein